MEIGDQSKLSYTAESMRLYGDNVKKQGFNDDHLKQNLSAFESFLYALKSPDAKRQYPSLLNKFFTFLAIRGNMDEKCSQLLFIAKKDPDLFQSNLMRYCSFQKDRIQKGEITDGTMRNYIKAIKLFCEMNDIRYILEENY